MGVTTNALCAGAIACAAGPALAEGGDWSFLGSIYLFAAETDTTIGDTKTTLSFSDALDNLDFAGMAALSATNGRWTFIHDLMYYNLGFSEDISNPVSNTAELDLKMTMFSVYGLYRVHETPTSFVNLGAGARYFKIDSEISLGSALPISVSRGFDDDWIDPVVAAQAHFDLNDKWSTTLFADYGNFDSDRETYQALVTFNYEFAENWEARFGYRYISVENNENTNDFRVEQSGPVIGVSYRF